MNASECIAISDSDEVIYNYNAVAYFTINEFNRRMQVVQVVFQRKIRCMYTRDNTLLFSSEAINVPSVGSFKGDCGFLLPWIVQFNYFIHRLNSLVKMQ